MMRKRLPQEEEDLCGGLTAVDRFCAGFSYSLAFSRALSTAFKSVIQV